MAIGFNLLKVMKIRVAFFLPAIAFAPRIYYLVAIFKNFFVVSKIELVAIQKNKI